MMNLFNPLSIYLIGMTAMVILAVVFSLSILYYNKAKNLAPYLHKISLLKAEVSELEAKRESLQAEVAHAEFLVQQGKDAEEWLKKHQEEIENLQRLLTERDNLLKEVNELKVTLGNEKSIWKNLDTLIVDERTLRKTEPKYYFEEKTWLEKFEKSLSENGFIFDSRAVRAFHTGLKCSQQTQLVVLAGISGTGKSLLPELYAAALGMNFLPVPVQPRWDSPQDLFGFYNYMEGRYKATELSRLLWQFDWYNGPAKDNEGYRSKDTLPLNLVLLDEMNLARVEYYFADLLSKLETRYGLNPDNEAERRKAEIELECNAADSIKSMRRLFVSPYTLFAGTMNEDESTQSLSDKVIDRANVLRFGRPKMIGDENETRCRKPNKSAFITSYANVPRITAKEWDNWLKPLDIAEEEAEALTFLRRTVSPVAKELDKVYRSYGFRVDDAMKLYVLNYPGEVKEAVADQIEMKILPKLNGIELQDVHFDSVKKTLAEAIDSTGDDRLREAFDEAANSDNGTFFKWRGVMR